MRFVGVPVCVLLLALTGGLAGATTFSVTTTNDSGVGSLREAILRANTNAGLDTIVFNISGSGPHTIMPLSELPAVTETVVIDGYSQNGATPNSLAVGNNAVLRIELNGDNAGSPGVNGLRISGGNCTIRGLAIDGFSGNGLQLENAGTNAILGNFIGTNMSGTASRPNAGSGIAVKEGHGNLIGGPAPHDRNVISGNFSAGIDLFKGRGNTIQGNYIGTDATGRIGLGNSQGIALHDLAFPTLIGGVVAGAGNLIGGNFLEGIFVFSPSNQIQGNIVGLNATGDMSIGNGSHGIQVESEGNIIGGIDRAAGNVISANAANGVFLRTASASNNIVAANLIGTAINRTSLLGNGGAGVRIEDAGNSTIGGSVAYAGNVIAGNIGNGVEVAGSTGNAILGNSIFANGGLGIDLDGDGVTPNDPGDSDAGANGRQNFPTLSSVGVGGNTVIEGTLSSAPDSDYRLEFFGNDGADPTGYGEGQSFLGAATVTTDALGNVDFITTFATNLTLGTLVTATATDATQNTSEFSPDVMATNLPPERPIILIDGLQPVGGSATVTNSAIIQIQPAFANAPILYTLDGSPPQFGVSYTNPFIARESMTLKALQFAGGVASHQANPIVLTVLHPPAITVQPQTRIVKTGDPATFEVMATGTQPLNYEWRWNASTLPGENDSTLLIRPAQPANAGFYDVIVSNLAGSVTSSQGELIVHVPPQIVTQPVGTNAVRGAPASFCVTASSVQPLSFQWRHNGVNIPGETNACYSIINVQVADGGTFTVVVQNEAGAVTSDPAVLLVDLPFLGGADNFSGRVSITGLTNAVRGTNIGFTHETGETNHAGKVGGPSAWYTWKAPADGIATFRTTGSGFDTLLAVYTNAILSKLKEVASDEDSGGFLTSAVHFNAVAGTDYAIAIDGFAGAEGNYTLSWEVEATSEMAPVIITAPQHRTVTAGATTTFEVVASGVLSYQWYFNSAAIPGATNAIFTRTNVQPPQVGYYYVRLTSSQLRYVDSAVAILEIGPVANVQSQDKLEDLIGSLGAGGSGLRQQLITDAAPVVGFISVGLGMRANQTINNTNNSSTSLNEINHCERIGRATRWLILFPTNNGVLFVDTVGSAIPTVAAIYQTTADGFPQLACAVNPPGMGNTAMRLPVLGNTEYWVVVDGYDGALGEINLNWGLGIPPSTNVPPTNPSDFFINEPVILNAGDAAVTNAIPLPSYQWLHEGFAIPGETGSVLRFAFSTRDLVGTYSVIASNFSGIVTNQIAKLRPPIDLTIVRSPLRPELQFRLTAPGGRMGVLETSTNLPQWLPLLTNSPNRDLSLPILDTLILPDRFFRFRPAPGQ